jgi:hypothetical protein
MSQEFWYDITPAEAKERFGENPNGAIGSGIRLPVNEMGEECPWPWEPQQLVGVPMGQYHCGYCGAMVLAGVLHFDYCEVEEERDERGRNNRRGTT